VDDPVDEFMLLPYGGDIKLREHNGPEGEQKRRKIDPKTKLAAVLERLNGESTVPDVCCT
jgi:hypothetical protein